MNAIEPDPSQIPFHHFTYHIDKCVPHANLIAGPSVTIEEHDKTAIFKAYENMHLVSEALHDCYTRPDPTLLYRYYDHAGCLLYVGITNGLERRDEQHLFSTQWRRDAKFMFVELFPYRYLAEEIESHAIIDEQPEFNVKSPNKHTLSHFRYADYFRNCSGKLAGEVSFWLDLYSERPWKAPTPRLPLYAGDSTLDAMKAARDFRTEKIIRGMEAASDCLNFGMSNRK